MLTDVSPFANHLWQSTLCAAAVWFLTLALKKNHAAVRYWLWLAASVKFLIPFSLLVSIGSQMGWRMAPVAVIAQPQWSSVVEDIGRPFVASAPALQAVTASPSNSLTAVLFGVWLLGFAVSMVFWFRALRQMRAARKAATPLALGLEIPVMSSPARLEPGVFGIRKPVLLLPEGIADRLTPDQLNAVLAHEMCHVRRRDNLTAAIHMVVEAVFWFYPLVWWIRAGLVEERERACDEAVLQSGCDAEVYAEGILSVCKFYVESPLACVSGISGSDLKKRIVRIMTERLAERLSLGRKLLLATMGVAMVAGPLIYGIVNAPQVSAQSPQPTVEPAPSFEVVSFKPSKSDDDSFAFGFFSANTFTAAGATLHQVIKGAYGVDDDQITGAPRWVDSEKYSIKAKVEDSVAAELHKLSDDQEALEEQRLLQSLLADRCKLMVHRESRNLPVYALVIAKNGPKLHQAKPGDAYPDSPIPKDLNGKSHGNVMMMGRGMLRGQGIPVTSLVQMLAQQQLGRAVIDKTGLTGNYDFTLQWTPDVGPAPAGNQQGSNTPPTDSGASIFTAIQEQLGLKLEPQKGSVEVLVIDHIERPSEN